MARKLSSKVKKSFGIFSGVVLAGMGGMGGAVVRAAGTVSDQYAMEIGSPVSPVKLALNMAESFCNKSGSIWKGTVKFTGN